MMLPIPDCACATWAQEMVLFVGGHNPGCEKFSIKNERKYIRTLLKGLIHGIEQWAADEDGVHPEAWAAYKEAVLVVTGQTVPERGLDV